MKNFQFSKYCTPAQLYLVLGAIGIIGAFFNNYSIETLLTNALFLVVWTWVLNWLCSKGFKAISWILVLLPFIMALFTYFFIRDVAVKEGVDPENLLDPKKPLDPEKKTPDLKGIPNCRNACMSDPAMKGPGKNGRCETKCRTQWAKY
jgi:hypothetical protein